MVSCSGSLVQSCCGEGGALQTNVIGLCGEHSQCSGHTGFAPLAGVCFPRLHCSGSWLLYRERALRCLRFQFLGPPQKRRLGWPAVCAFPARAAQADRNFMGALSPVHAPSPLRRPSLSFLARQSGACALCLFCGRDPPGRCRPSRISGSVWLETGSLCAVW